MQRKLPGFTLLELLVVVAIIGILITMGAVAFSTAQRKTRDARRRGDISAIQKAYEQYYAENGTYNVNGCADGLGDEYLPGGSPTDPQTGNYTCTYDAVSYCVCAGLEDEDSGNATNATCTFGTGDYYCSVNLQ